jgi:hypothetical protein
MMIVNERTACMASPPLDSVPVLQLTMQDAPEITFARIFSKLKVLGYQHQSWMLLAIQHTLQ